MGTSYIPSVPPKRRRAGKHKEEGQRGQVLVKCIPVKQKKNRFNWINFVRLLRRISLVGWGLSGAMRLGSIKALRQGSEEVSSP